VLIPSDRLLVGASASAVVAAVAVVALVLAFGHPARPGGTAPSQGAGAAAARSSPSGSPASASPSGTDAGAGGTGTVVVLDVRVPAWRDVIAAWHAQALIHVRNEGDQPLAMVPSDARIVVSDGGRVVHEGTVDGAIPMILAAGEDGYLVAGFTTDGDLADPQVQVDATGVAPTGFTELDVAHATVAEQLGRPIVTGTAQNPGKEPVRDGAVAAIILDKAGHPLAGLIDAASLGVLAPGAERAFRAAEPVAPPFDADAVGKLLVGGWARVADGPTPQASP
jgi:hypothetical protein